MKKIVIGGLGILLILGVVRFLASKSQISKPAPATNYSIRTTPLKSVFVPYWSGEINEKDTRYTTYYYFGIRPTREGKIYEDEGLKQITLVENIPNKNKELVLRMLDASVTEIILKNKDIQKTLISEVQNILVKKSFSGLILDIEIPFTLQANKQNQITQFVQQMCTVIKANYKSCDMLVYGDFSYRKRPYDLKKLGQYADKILLMAYDFHKSGGEPGPNFPFDSGSASSPSLRASPLTINYGYDFKQMISDAISLVPKEKIEVVFGMYGYDWTLNEQGTPLKSAKALTLKEIQALNSNSKMLYVTSYVLHGNDAREKNIQYVDAEGQKHIIWYEDEESAQIKTNYLQEQGISKVSYWAYGYY